MYHKARRVALNTISRTPLEPIARKIYGVLVPSKGNKYDKQTFALMRKVLTDSSNCIDVGAYRGEILGQIVKIAPKGKHFAFEPVPENHSYLEKKFPHATIHNLALSSKKGKTTFNHVVGRAARSGLMKVEYPDAHQEVREIDVTIDTLDNVIPKKTQIDFLKIDVEGAELGVLEGAKKLIARCKPVIVFEHELEKAQPYGVKAGDAYELLAKDLGMSIYLLEDFLEGKKPLTQKAFADAVKKNTDFYFVAASK